MYDFRKKAVFLPTTKLIHVAQQNRWTNTKIITRNEKLRASKKGGNPCTNRKYPHERTWTDPGEKISHRRTPLHPPDYNPTD